MTERLSAMSDEEFARLWDAARDVDEATDRVREAVGRVPRWAVLARASALRRRGVDLRQHELRGRAG